MNPRQFWVKRTMIENEISSCQDVVQTMGDVYSLFQQESFLICSVLTLITALVHVLFQYSECEHVTSPHPSATSHHHHQQPTDYQTTFFPAPVGHFL